MKKLNLAMISGILAFVMSCSSPSKVKRLEDEDTKLKDANPVGTENVGIKDDHIVVQKKVYLSENLRRLQNEVKELERLIYGARKNDPGGLYLLLRECHQRASDKRIGGDGKYPGMERIARLTGKDPEYKYGLDSKDHLVAISDEFFHERINRYRKFKEILEKRHTDFQEDLGVCEAKYRSRLIDYGLDPDDTKAKGEWVEGPNGYRVWKMRRPPTYDPEELQRRKARRLSNSKTN